MSTRTFSLRSSAFALQHAMAIAKARLHAIRARKDYVPDYTLTRVGGGKFNSFISLPGCDDVEEVRARIHANAMANDTNKEVFGDIQDAQNLSPVLGTVKCITTAERVEKLASVIVTIDSFNVNSLCGQLYMPRGPKVAVIETDGLGIHVLANTILRVAKAGFGIFFMGNAPGTLLERMVREMLLVDTEWYFYMDGFSYSHEYLQSYSTSVCVLRDFVERGSVLLSKIGRNDLFEGLVLLAGLDVPQDVRVTVSNEGVAAFLECPECCQSSDAISRCSHHYRHSGSQNLHRALSVGCCNPEVEVQPHVMEVIFTKVRKTGSPGSKDMAIAMLPYVEGATRLVRMDASDVACKCSWTEVSAIGHSGYLRMTTPEGYHDPVMDTVVQTLPLKDIPGSPRSIATVFPDRSLLPARAAKQKGGKDRVFGIALKPVPTHVCGVGIDGPARVVQFNSIYRKEVTLLEDNVDVRNVLGMQRDAIPEERGDLWRQYYDSRTPAFLGGERRFLACSHSRSF